MILMNRQLEFMSKVSRCLPTLPDPLPELSGVKPTFRQELDVILEEFKTGYHGQPNKDLPMQSPKVRGKDEPSPPQDLHAT